MTDLPPDTDRDTLARIWQDGYDAATDDHGGHDATPIRQNPYRLTGHRRSTSGRCRTCATPYPCEVRRAADAQAAHLRAHTPPAPTTSPDPLRELLETLPPDHHERPGLARAIEVLRLAAADPRPDQGWQEGDRG